jgi:hypothetical protein
MNQIPHEKGYRIGRNTVTKTLLKPAARGISGGAAKKEGRMFFFEKKNQKTFVYCGALHRGTGRSDQEQKFFGSFFQKRTPCLCFLSRLIGPQVRRQNKPPPQSSALCGPIKLRRGAA